MKGWSGLGYTLLHDALVIDTPPKRINRNPFLIWQGHSFS